MVSNLFTVSCKSFQSVLRSGHHVGPEMACQLSKLQRCMLNQYEPRMKEVVQHHHHDTAQVRDSYRIFEPPYIKTSKMTLHPAKTQISLGIGLVWSESSLCTQWVAKGPSFHHADSKDSDQTGQMHMLIWVFAGRTCHFVGFVMRWLIYTYTIYAYFAPDPLRSYFDECQKMKFISYIDIVFCSLFVKFWCKVKR